ncbi:MAG: YchJ family protein [Gammaproteobacteria bacterium]|nr:YchJ family protein [Gammaproteobacteria bacterium]
MENCPCGTELAYLQCCGKFIIGNAIPTTPEELMRSRYTAYTMANVDYIATTMKAPANKDFDPETAREWAEQVQWLKLEIVQTKQETNEKGSVEFLAHYADENKRYILHEISDFHFENGHWYYVDGRGSDRKSLPQQKTSLPNRNDPCHCGSDVKFKKCCGHPSKTS